MAAGVELAPGLSGLSTYQTPNVGVEGLDMKSCRKSVVSSLAMIAACATAMAAEPASKPAEPVAKPVVAAEARIPFANHGGIYTWQVENDRSLLIQSQGRKWYRATLFSSCFDLPFSDTIGFETDSSGSFDKFSSIRVREQTCRLSSLVETAAPPKKQKPPVKPIATPAAKAAERG